MVRKAGYGQFKMIIIRKYLLKFVKKNTLIKREIKNFQKSSCFRNNHFQKAELYQFIIKTYEYNFCKKNIKDRLKFCHFMITMIFNNLCMFFEVIRHALICLQGLQNAASKDQQKMFVYLGET